MGATILMIALIVFLVGVGVLIVFLSNPPNRSVDRLGQKKKE